MIYLLASDIHGDLSTLRGLVLKNPEAGAFLLLGDVQASPEEISPFVSVLGNSDLGYRDHYPLHREIVFESGKKALLAHHPLPNRALDRLIENGYSYFLHGHTHVREDRLYRGLRILCPGSTSFPRDGGMGSYILIDSNPDGEKVLFKET